MSTFVTGMGWVFIALLCLAAICAVGAWVEDVGRRFKAARKAEALEADIAEYVARVANLEAALELARATGPYRSTQAPSKEER